MENLNLNYSGVSNFIDEKDVKNIENILKESIEKVERKNGEGKEFLGWLDLPLNYDKEEFERIKKAAIKIKNQSKVLIVIGIGGSYLGARAVIECLKHTFYNSKKDELEIYFAGQNISSRYLKHLIEIIDGRDFSVNVISKSGTTTEPAIAFRIFKEILEKKYGEEARERIYVTTDKNKGALKNIADEKGYEKFSIPDDVGGRFSVLTAVGLLPIAAASLDIDKLMEGASTARENFKNDKENDCYKYAMFRNILYRKGYSVELLASYEPRLHYVAEWWKQLYGESEGKNHGGLFPASVDLTSDLHSMGQYIQDGKRIIIETVLNIENGSEDENIFIKENADDLDGLNYLKDKSLNYVNEKALKGTLLAHIDGGVPCFVINIPKMDEFYLGYLIYFFEKACAVSGYILGINPFDQPGVESYKKNMFALLGKKGYESLSQELNKRLNENKDKK